MIVNSNLLNQFYQGWIELTIDHSGQQFEVHQSNNRDFIATTGVYVYSLNQVCLYVGQGNYGTGHLGNRLICHYNEAQWKRNGEGYKYSTLFNDSIPTLNVVKKNYVKLPGGHSNISQVRFFSNPELRKKLTVYWIEISQKKCRKHLESELTYFLNPIYIPTYTCDTVVSYTDKIKNRMKKFDNDKMTNFSGQMCRYRQLG